MYSNRLRPSRACLPTLALAMAALQDFLPALAEEIERLRAGA